MKLRELLNQRTQGMTAKQYEEIKKNTPTPFHFYNENGFIEPPEHSRWTKEQIATWKRKAAKLQEFERRNGIPESERAVTALKIKVQGEMPEVEDGHTSEI